MLVEPGRDCAPCRGVSALVTFGTGMGMNASGVAVGVRWRRWVHLGGHNPSERREGWVGSEVDWHRAAFFVHAEVGWGKERKVRGCSKWEGKREGGEGRKN